MAALTGICWRRRSCPAAPARSGPATSVSAVSAPRPSRDRPSTPTTARRSSSTRDPQGGQGRRVPGARIRPHRDAGRLADRHGPMATSSPGTLYQVNASNCRDFTHTIYIGGHAQKRPRHRLPPAERHLAAGDLSGAAAMPAGRHADFVFRATRSLSSPPRLGSVDGRDASLDRHGGARRRRLAVRAAAALPGAPRRGRAGGRGRCRSIATSSARSTATSIAA